MAIFRAKVRPKSKQQKVEQGKNCFIVWVKAQARDGQATAEAKFLLENYLGKKICLIKGAKSRTKYFKIIYKYKIATPKIS